MQRRTVLQLFAALPSVPAAELHTHEAPQETIGKAPIYFSSREYQMLRTLCQLIVPPDGKIGGAIEAGAPEFIDLLTSENADYQRRLSGGLLWLDTACATRFNVPFLDCNPQQQRDVLDLIAFRSNGDKDPALVPGIQFFAFLRDLVLDGFFTSPIGIEYLQFRGNHVLASFPGCPK
jgi:hypothetical protein